MKKIVLAAMLGLMVTGGPAGAFSLPELFQMDKQTSQQSGTSNQPLVLVQGNDAAIRIQQLEEQIRQLNGRIEEMSFQLLQMQEQMRKTQEDNEFRFQELEKSENGAAGKPAVAASGPDKTVRPGVPEDDVARIIETPPDVGRAGREAPPETVLGSIEFDQNGNPRAVTRNDDANNAAGLPGVNPVLPPGQADAPGRDQSSQQTASSGSEGDDYQIAYNHVLSGDYALAEQQFTRYLAEYPDGSRSADASFWLGEAQYSQGKFNEAAKTFLNAHQTYGKSSKAPEMLLKLGMSLAALDNSETACATLQEVKKRYPKAQRAVLAKVSSEQKRLGC